MDDFLHHDETKNLKQREKQRGWFADKVCVPVLTLVNPVNPVQQINEMAGGGQRGELDEGKF